MEYEKEIEVELLGNTIRWAKKKPGAIKPQAIYYTNDTKNVPRRPERIAPTNNNGSNVVLLCVD